MLDKAAVCVAWFIVAIAGCARSNASNSGGGGGLCHGVAYDGDKAACDRGCRPYTCVIECQPGGWLSECDDLISAVSSSQVASTTGVGGGGGSGGSGGAPTDGGT